MKIILSIVAMSLILVCCRSEKKLMDRSAGYVTSEPVDLTVNETSRDTLVIDESTEPEPARPEKVTLTQGKELMSYCIIVGSFSYESNAVRLRNSLIESGFLGSSILRNSEGMYRVSAECEDSHVAAWQEVSRIRSQYPQFHDAWLLEVKE